MLLTLKSISVTRSWLLHQESSLHTSPVLSCAQWHSHDFWPNSSKKFMAVLPGPENYSILISVNVLFFGQDRKPLNHFAIHSDTFMTVSSPRQGHSTVAKPIPVTVSRLFDEVGKPLHHSWNDPSDTFMAVSPRQESSPPLLNQSQWHIHCCFIKTGNHSTIWRSIGFSAVLCKWYASSPTFLIYI